MAVISNILMHPSNADAMHEVLLPRTPDDDTWPPKWSERATRHDSLQDGVYNEEAPAHAHHACGLAQLSTDS